MNETIGKIHKVQNNVAIIVATIISVMLFILISGNKFTSTVYKSMSNINELNDDIMYFANNLYIIRNY